jgi:hypothetical protein
MAPEPGFYFLSYWGQVRYVEVKGVKHPRVFGADYPVTGARLKGFPRNAMWTPAPDPFGLLDLCNVDNHVDRQERVFWSD